MRATSSIDLSRLRKRCPMKVLMLSTDASILESGSESWHRMKDYGTLTDRLDIIVCTAGPEKPELKISETTRAIPTNSRSKLLYVPDIVRAAKKAYPERADKPASRVAGLSVTSQDPFETGLAGWLIARRLRAKLQLQVHTDFLSPYFSRESLKNRIRVMLAKWLLPKADGIRVVSERIKRSIINLGLPEAKIIVLPIFVDVVKIQSERITVDLHKKYPQFDFIILMASRLELEKNVRLAIDAMKEIVKKYPKTGLVIVGSGSLKKELERQVRELDLEDNVKFEGWISDLETYISYYRTSDAYLLCSNYEGYGLVLIIAASAGLPIITTDVGVAGEMKIKDSGLVVRVCDKQAIVDKIITLRSDENLRKGLRLRAKEFVTEQEFKTKEEYLKRYKQSWEMALQQRN